MRGFVKVQEKFSQMDSAAGDIDTFNKLARSLERSEDRQCGAGVIQARKNIARRMGITADTIENIRTLRSKIVPHWLLNRLRAELITSLQSEMANLEHEIQLHKQTGADHTGDALVAAETQLQAAREILRAEAS
jgi:plasmid maintenance system antidote protein VapI